MVRHDVRGVGFWSVLTWDGADVRAVEALRHRMLRDRGFDGAEMLVGLLADGVALLGIFIIEVGTGGSNATTRRGESGSASAPMLRGTSHINRA